MRRHDRGGPGRSRRRRPCARRRSSRTPARCRRGWATATCTAAAGPRWCARTPTSTARSSPTRPTTSPTCGRSAPPPWSRPAAPGGERRTTGAASRRAAAGGGRTRPPPPQQSREGVAEPAAVTRGGRRLSAGHARGTGHERSDGSMLEQARTAPGGHDACDRLRVVRAGADLRPRRVPDRRRHRLHHLELLLSGRSRAGRSPALPRARRTVRHDPHPGAQRGSVHREHGPLSRDRSELPGRQVRGPRRRTTPRRTAPAEILAELQAAEYPDSAWSTIVKNRGKAHAFNVALAFAKGDFILSNDADTKPNPDALWQYMSYFEREGGQNVGAVTGQHARRQPHHVDRGGPAERAELDHRPHQAFAAVLRRALRLLRGQHHVPQAGGARRRRLARRAADRGHRDRLGHAVGGLALPFAPHVRFFLDVPEKLRRSSSSADAGLPAASTCSRARGPRCSGTRSETTG